MAVERTFSEAFINAPHVVLGRRLRPFSLWHLFLLQTLDSPYLTGGTRAVEPFDLKTAVGVCSLRFDETKVRRPWGPGVWWSCRSQSRFSEESNKLISFIGDYLQRPDFNVITPDNAKTQTPRGQPPDVLQIAWDLMSGMGCSERYAWEMPLGKAYWYQSMHIKDKHDTDFMTPEEREYQTALKAKMAAEKAAQQK